MIRSPAADPRVGRPAGRAASKPVYQRASASFSAGKHVRAKLSVKLTSTGLLAVGGLVSAILLSTTVLVRTAVREGERTT